MEDNKNVFNEIKELEEKKNQINKSITELNEFSSKLQDKLNEENIHLEDKIYQYNIAKDKLKNEGEIKILQQEAEKLEQFLQLLDKQYELELKYIEQYCDHKSKIEKMSEKYSHINFNDILSLKELFNKQFFESNINHVNTNHVNTNHINANHVNTSHVNSKIENDSKQSMPPPPPPPLETTIKRRNTISTIVKNPDITNSVNDVIQNGSLQDQLKHAFSTRYKALRPDSPDNSFD